MIVFTSRTGNIRHIVDKLQLPNLELSENLIMNQPYLLLIYTDGLGNIPGIVNSFLTKMENIEYLKGVAASGNINFGESFCGSADIISETYGVPIIRKIDLRGKEEDVISIKTQYEKYIGVNE